MLARRAAALGEVVEFVTDNAATEGDAEIGLGEVCGRLSNPPVSAGTIRARITVLDDASVMTLGDTPVVHAHLTQAACTVEKIECVFDPVTGAIIEESPDFIDAGQAAEVVLDAQKPITLEPVTSVPELGVFAARDDGKTVAVGVVSEIQSITSRTALT